MILMVLIIISCLIFNLITEVIFIYRDFIINNHLMSEQKLKSGELIFAGTNYKQSMQVNCINIF